MRSLFWKIFLWFWLSMTILIAATATLTWSMRPTVPRFASEPDSAPNGRRYLPATESMTMLARLSAAAYLHGGASAIPTQWARGGSSRQVESWLMSADGRVLAHTLAAPWHRNWRARRDAARNAARNNSSQNGTSQTSPAQNSSSQNAANWRDNNDAPPKVSPADLQTLTRRALRNQRMQTLARKGSLLAATSTQTEDGQRFVFVASMRIPQRVIIANSLANSLPPRRVFPLFWPIFESGEPVQRAVRFFAMLAIAGIFCFLLARHLTRPVTQLRTATRLLERGQLSARVSPQLQKRRDELGDLGRDFNAMATRLEALMNAQRRLISDVSHELRSPLARLGIALELARRHSNSFPQTSSQNANSPDFAVANAESSTQSAEISPTNANVPLTNAHNRIEREAARLEEIVGQLLMLSRLENGAPNENKVLFDVENLVREVADDVRFEAKSKGRDIEVTSDETQIPSVKHSRHDASIPNSLSFENSTRENEISTEKTPIFPEKNVIPNSNSAKNSTRESEISTANFTKNSNEIRSDSHLLNSSHDVGITEIGAAKVSENLPNDESFPTSNPAQLSTLRTENSARTEISRVTVAHENASQLPAAREISAFALNGSRTLLRGALENVLRNAVRFAPPQSCVQIEINRVAATSKSAAQIVIRVLDRGPGVPEEALPKLFEPFYRAEEARDRQSGGTGLGLAIAERAVQLHGGTICAFNRNANGEIERGNSSENDSVICVESDYESRSTNLMSGISQQTDHENGGLCVEIILPQTSI